MALSTTDLAILIIIALAGGAYLFSGSSKKAAEATSAHTNGSAKTSSDESSTGRDFVAAMEKAVSHHF